MQILTAFGQYEGRTCDLLLYVIDNEIQPTGPTAGLALLLCGGILRAIPPEGGQLSSIVKH